MDGAGTDDRIGAPPREGATMTTTHRITPRIAAEAEADGQCVERGGAIPHPPAGTPSPPKGGTGVPPKSGPRAPRDRWPFIGHRTQGEIIRAEGANRCTTAIDMARGFECGAAADRTARALIETAQAFGRGVLAGLHYGGCAAVLALVAWIAHSEIARLTAPPFALARTLMMADGLLVVEPVARFATRAECAAAKAARPRHERIELDCIATEGGR